MPHHASDIRVGNGSATVWIDPGDVYFTFPNALLAYNCHTCGAKCCRGFGYSTAIGPSLDRLLEERPALTLFLEPTGEIPPARYHTSNCAPECFFLSASGLCGIHTRYGYDAKPETCRLFPFNYFRRLGRHLIVGPHVALCPLQVSPPGVFSDLSDHERLTEEMHSQGIASPVLACTSIWGTEKQTLDLELAIRALASASVARPYTKFVEDQLTLTKKHTAGFQHVAFDDGPAPAAVDRFVASCCSVLGIPQSDVTIDDSELSRTFAVLTPIMRATLVLRDEGQHGIGFDRMIGVSRIPFYMLSAFIVACCAKRAGMQSFTYQSLCQLLQQFQPLLRLLACSDIEVRWRRSALVTLPRLEQASLKPHFVRLARDLLPSHHAHHRATLGELLCLHTPVQGVDRVIFLKQVAGALAHHLERADVPHPEVAQPSLRKRARAITQRIVLAGLGERVLVAAYDRIFAPAKG